MIVFCLKVLFLIVPANNMKTALLSSIHNLIGRNEEIKGEHLIAVLR